MNLKYSLTYLGWYDLIFLVPMFFLFAYLPTYNVWSILLNVIIVIFFSIGLATITHIVIGLVGKK
ncbi:MULTISPECIES: DUF6007 family protein [Staphylococcus]|uniref:Uncharacterized protein n=1 Tax=Staphylococcus pettenkoferi TaxID=170573 RepID=A0A2N6QHE0_9STAP|nr:MULTISPECIES: DUF6007 family protein [Staphylococcus]MBX8994167.1 hypothetical protein [Staphylococcus pettenkoferi]MCI2791495.1 DUF6007 family protein [Staphylococcus pettenkoferi]MCY1567194.1 DUF6007 family protein [Staphylococcus pettenkoferi]MCY1588463.1 DUF6007 family protein [Staphylococcus pettenkoferi]OFK76691.1 hypothetical protein HMPREF2802_10735 [Staphylococcus sp. HMSC071G07]